MQMWFYLSWKKKAQSKTDWSAEMGSYRFPVWTSEVPLLVLCQPSHLDGRLLDPLHRMPGAHTLAALPQIGSVFQCLWCLLAVCSSSGRWNTTRKRGQIKIPDTPQLSFAFTVLRIQYCPLIKWKGLTPDASSAYPGRAACPSAGPPRWRKNREGSPPLSVPELHEHKTT